jgi:hypothetical protein
VFVCVLTSEKKAHTEAISERARLARFERGVGEGAVKEETNRKWEVFYVNGGCSFFHLQNLMCTHTYT